MDEQHDDPTPPAHHDARIRLVVELVTFQLKIAVEALRDIFLSPVTIVAVIAGLVAGGDRPDRYFREVLRFGRRSDLWLNVYGERRRGPSADEFVKPLEDSLVAKARSVGSLQRGVGQVNQMLDAMNRKHRPRDEDEST